MTLRKSLCPWLLTSSFAGHSESLWLYRPPAGFAFSSCLHNRIQPVIVRLATVALLTQIIVPVNCCMRCVGRSNLLLTYHKFPGSSLHKRAVEGWNCATMHLGWPQTMTCDGGQEVSVRTVCDRVLRKPSGRDASMARVVLVSWSCLIPPVRLLAFMTGVECRCEPAPLPRNQIHRTHLMRMDL